MDCTKEFDHKSGHTHDTCRLCKGNSKAHGCSKCKGLCIFSNSFFKNYHTLENSEKTAAEKYHTKEFALIRGFIDLNIKKREEEEIKTDEVNDDEQKSKSKSKPKKVHKKAYYSEGEEEDDEIDMDQMEVYDILKRFHKLTHEQKREILIKHSDEFWGTYHNQMKIANSDNLNQSRKMSLL